MAHPSNFRLLAREKKFMKPRQKSYPVFLIALICACIFPVCIIVFAAKGEVAWVVILGIVIILYNSLQTLIILLLARLPSKRPRLYRNPGKIPKIAVIIPAWNEAAALPNTLATILAQDDAPDSIIIADDGSTDDTIPKLKNLYKLKFQETIGKSEIYPHLQVISKEHSGKGDSMNQALAYTNAEVVLFLDADTRLYPNSIRALRSCFTLYPSLSAVSGTILPSCSKTWRGRLFQFGQRYEYARQHIWRLAWSYLNSTLIIPGACSAFRRELLLEIGGFSNQSWVEDYEIMYRMQRYLRLKQRACRVKVEPKLLVETDAPETIMAFLRQRRRWAGGFLETLLTYRGMVGDRRFGILGCGYLINNTFTIVTPFYSLAWLVAGLILYYQKPPHWIYGFEMAIGAFILGIITSTLTIDSFRYYFGRYGVSPLLGIVDLLLSPLFYLPMMVISNLWGYTSCLRRQKTW